MRRSGAPYPLLYGLGVNVKTGEIFPAQFTDKGPDMDIRQARILTGKEKEKGMIDIYDYNREEMRIGPFSYEPMRAVDIWLAQTDEFILQCLHPCPEVSPPSWLPQLRQTLKRIKADPYPSVSIFGSGQPRTYRKDDITGQWVSEAYLFYCPGVSTWVVLQVRYNKEPDGWAGSPVVTPTQQHNFKQEPSLATGWPPIPVQSQLYY